jgi:hypothetical protein
VGSKGRKEGRGNAWERKKRRLDRDFFTNLEKGHFFIRQYFRRGSECKTSNCYTLGLYLRVY